MNKIKNGFTLVELIIVMVLLGILAAVAVPRMSNTIQSAEENAEQKFLGNLVSALEIHANDQFVKNSVKSYPYNPFDALEVMPDDNKWQFDGMYIHHYRNGFHNGDFTGNEHQMWEYMVSGPGDGNCYDNNGDQTDHGCYTINGPGYNDSY